MKRGYHSDRGVPQKRRATPAIILLGTDVPSPIDENEVAQAANVALASAAIVFVLTFGLSQFATASLKEQESNAAVLDALRAYKLQSVPVVEASKRWRWRSVIVDVRSLDAFYAAHVPSSVALPLYRSIVIRGPASFARQLAFAFFGSKGSELNPEFDSTALSTLPRWKEVIVACADGGTIETTKTYPRGKASRSLKAAKRLLDLGFTNVKHLDGGIREWEAQGLPLVKSNE